MFCKPLYFFNTATRQKELFRPIEEGKAKLYTCGPTVYHYAHIGNLRTYVFEDLLIRALREAGYQVMHVMNITDVGHLVSDADEGEDRMEKGSLREGKSAWEIADYYSKVFFSDLKKLNCIEPNFAPKATDHISEMIDMVKTLEAKGFTYRTSDGIYFDTSRFPKYAAFARLNVENLEAGIRVSMGEKRHPTDFALWKFSPPDKKRQMEWDSTWGRGFPGWHIECSAMSMKFLGETFDIHCGGKDHIPVHHTNEIAQSECATGKPFANFWLHGEFLVDDTGKMSKRTGDFLTLSRVEEKGFRPVDYRFLLLQAHYRTEIHFDWPSLQAAQAGFNGIMNRLADWDLSQALAPVSSVLGKKQHRDFEAAINDDLNTPAAMTVLFEMLRDPNLDPQEKRSLLNAFDLVLGLGFEREFHERRSVQTDPETDALVKARDDARSRKDWKESDRLRKVLTEKGYRVEDTPKGTRVTKI